MLTYALTKVNTINTEKSKKYAIIIKEYIGTGIAYNELEVRAMVYECVVKKGHTGAGKFNEQKIYVHANNIMDAMEAAMNAGGVKKGRSNSAGQSIMEVKEVKN